MARLSRQVVIPALGAVLALGLGVAPADAGIIPALSIDWWVNGTYAGKISPSGVANGNGTYSYSGLELDELTGVSLNYTLTGDPDPLLSGGLVVQNPNLPLVNIVMVVQLPISVNFSQTELAGSAAVGLTTNSDGGELNSIGGEPVWQGLLDGVAVGPSASLFFDPFEISHSGSQSTGASGNFGLPNAVVGGSVSQTIGIRIAFSLTQNDQASITSVFNVVPGPGGLAVLACGLLFSRRRRRECPA